jgi:hypothetical protein
MADVGDAIEFLHDASDAESDNRQRGLEALKFRYGSQWPQYAVASRGLDRPQLTINETNTYIKKVTNAQRQQRPRGKASPVDNFADKKIAKIITGLGRHIEVNSDADNAYDTAFDFAATIGWGYWRLRTDYIADDSFNQDIYVDMIDNPFSVYFDPNSKLPDGSDGEKALVTDVMLKTKFEKMYPGATLNGLSDRGSGDSDPDWVLDKDIRIAEYFYIDRVKAKLVMLTDGTVLWADEISKIQKLLSMAGIGVRGDRDSLKSVVKWQKQTAFDVLEEKTLPGRWIPIIPMYWTNVIIDSRRVRQGLVQDAMDPQRMVNFWQTSITESIALAPKAKWLIAEGSDEDHENEFARANLSASPTLHYKTTGVDGRDIPPPQRIAPEPPPAGAIEASFMASQNLSRVMGIFDPGVRGGAQHKSDKTLNAEQGQSEITNFDGYDNLVRSIKHSWRVMLSWMPSVYDTQRVQRIIGEDGREDLVTLNEKTQGQDESGQAIEKVLNDITVGTYDVVMDVGPGYDTKRKEGVVATMELMATPIGEKVAQVADDLIVRQMDFPGAEAIADRLAAANPLSQVDEKSDVPPQAQMQLKAAQQQIQQLQQQLQEAGIELKFGLKKEQMKQDAETKRTLMTTTSKAHESEMWAQEEARQVDSVERTRIHDTQTRALSAQHVEEIRGMVQLLLKHLDTAQLEKETEENERETMQ